MKAKTIVALILIVLALILVFQNTAVVTFRFFFWNPAMSLIVWLLIVLVIGFVAGYLTGSLGRSRKKAHGAGV
jgi:uncharacterized integral membrane protein